jgi:hypothetical protein
MKNMLSMKLKSKKRLDNWALDSKNYKLDRRFLIGMVKSLLHLGPRIKIKNVSLSIFERVVTKVISLKSTVSETCMEKDIYVLLN